MSAVFLRSLNMSITAGWLILAVMLVRTLFKRIPKWIMCLLWALVAVRLVIPFSLKSDLSLIPSSETIPHDIALMSDPVIDSGIPKINEIVNPIITESFTPELSNTVNPLQVVIYIASLIWITGITVLLIHALISYYRLKKSVSGSIDVGDRLMICDDITTPFILGLFRPMIYIPSSLEGETLRYVISHENAHLARRDHWWKPLGYLILTVYWFNPLCWLAYVFLCKDIEAACDEEVINNMDRNSIAGYSQALLDCSIHRRMIAACPLAFGENDVKHRIKGILNYRKPAFWIILVSIILCIVVAVLLMTDPFPSSKILEMERSDISGITVTSQINVPVKVVSLSEKDIDSFVEYCNSLKLRYKGTTEEKGGWQYFFNVTKKNGEMMQISVMDDRHIKVDNGEYVSSKSLNELTEFVVGLDYPVDEPEDGGTGYEACSFITYRNSHYEIGVEIHTNHRTPVDLKLIDIQEFKGMVTLVEDSQPENEVKYYCNSGTFTQHYQEWNTVDIREEDIGKVIDIMRRHIYELTLADLEGYYPAINDSIVLDVVVDIEGYSGNTGEAAVLGKGDLIVPLREVSSIIEGFEPLQHRYIEFAAPEGTDVIAAYSGKVGSMDYIDKKGYYVIIEQDNIVQIMYSHMASLSVSTGDTVKQGDVIGTIGSTGDGRDSSLEFRVFVPSMGMLENQIDPKLLLPDIDQ